jgi:hypothetical protein
MTPVDQRLFIDRDGRGDCWPCCIATILDLPYDHVPEFGKPIEGENPAGSARARRQNDETSYWLASLGLQLRYVSQWEMRPLDHRQRYVIGVGRTLRGTQHGVVCDMAVPVIERPDDGGVLRNFMHVAHDPHPSRSGLIIQHQAIELVPIEEAS